MKCMKCGKEIISITKENVTLYVYKKPVTLCSNCSNLYKKSIKDNSKKNKNKLLNYFVKFGIDKRE